MTPLSIRHSWICLKVGSSRGAERSTPLSTAPTWGVSFSTLIVAGAMAASFGWRRFYGARLPSSIVRCPRMRNSPNDPGYLSQESSPSRCRVAAVHRQRHTCHEFRLVAGEIEDGCGHIQRLAEAAERVALLERLMPSRITEKGRG